MALLITASEIVDTDSAADAITILSVIGKLGAEGWSINLERDTRHDLWHVHLHQPSKPAVCGAGDTLTDALAEAVEQIITLP